MAGGDREQEGGGDGQEGGGGGEEVEESWENFQTKGSCPGEEILSMTGLPTGWF